MQLDDVFECLNNRQLDKIFSSFVHRLKDTNKWDRESCAKLLDIIATKASIEHFLQLFLTLMSGLKDDNKNIRESRTKSLGVISEKLNEK
ncbi:hypothetical protein RFI_39595 [Reticulomyxa filosa]|uniref:Condensin complex subunit 1 C-terminal domain-containing protein n=1 Tax=Reticulomyxa filosa TaxID=46433 RepID=X6L9Z2_RETFI|nr:hypothetical protein RFI_39595 [Reticulomyxa filosa]|eukprot:ETN97931.1 hypothetical protein RFI_39595 [Reticulomyxa filosa]